MKSYNTKQRQSLTVKVIAIILAALMLGSIIATAIMAIAFF